MRRNEKLTYISGDSSVVFATNKNSSPYWWNNADGLDGLDNNIFTIKGSGQDGETFIGQNLQARVITVDGQMLKDANARQQLIRAVNPKSTGKLVYENGEITRWIPCAIRKAPAIARDGTFPAFQVEFYCPYPFWREGNGENQGIANIALWVPAFEFELEIPEDGFEFGCRTPSLIVNVKNNGDVDTGMLIEFRATGSTSNPSLININTQEFLSLTCDMQAGDVIRIATGYGQKRAELTRGNVTTNIFNLVDADSTWLQLAVGDNLLRYDATETDNIEAVIYCDAAYLGV